MGKKNAAGEEERPTFAVTTKSGKTYNLPVDVEEGSIAHGLEKFKTGYDDSEVMAARKREQAKRAGR